MRRQARPWMLPFQVNFLISMFSDCSLSILQIYRFLNCAWFFFSSLCMISFLDARLNLFGFSPHFFLVEDFLEPSFS